MQERWNEREWEAEEYQGKHIFCRKSLIAFGVTKIASFLVMNEHANANSTIESHIEWHLRISKREIYGKSKITHPSSWWWLAMGGQRWDALVMHIHAVADCIFCWCWHISQSFSALSQHYAAILICVFCLRRHGGKRVMVKTFHDHAIPVVRKCFGVVE